MTNNVVVLGSINVDTILQIPRLPLPGETLLMGEKNNAGGGKGANQAVAAARSGAKTAFIGKVGNDENGKMMLNQFAADNIDANYVGISKETGTGQAFILLDDQGQNSILVYSGTNQLITQQDVIAAEALIKQADFLISQFEVPLEVIQTAFEIAQQNNVKTILNPAPAITDIPQSLLALTDLFIPNETECQAVTGIEITDETSMLSASRILNELGVKDIIITLGSKGAFFKTPEAHGFVPAFKVKALDTTAAGDTFIGALSTQLKKDFSNIEAAILFANKASSIAVQKLGAQPSIPTLAQIKQ